MKRFFPVIIAAILIVGGFWYGRQPVPNPDPNHTHVDFALWVDINADTILQVDFSGPQYMSEVYEEGREMRVDPMRKYLHLHDGNGHVIHSHKPGLTIGDFFASLGGAMIKGPAVIDGQNYPENTIEWLDGEETVGRSGNIALGMFVNGTEVPFDPEYPLKDGDKILLISTNNKEQINDALSHMTDDSCRYSQTCPWRGPAPTENCIADPEVPCVAPEN